MPTLFTRLASITGALLAMTSMHAQSHGRWLVPSHLMLSGENPHTITVDMSISNELFKPDHGFLSKKPDSKQGPPVSVLNMIGPDSTASVGLPFTYLKRKSVGAIELTQDGTHHIYLAQAPVHYTNFVRADGKPWRAWGPRHLVELPEGATNPKAYKMLSTINSYVSRNKLSEPKLIGRGLELKAAEHPNDLFVGETSRFQLLFNGTPLASPTELLVVREGTRYRNDRETLAVTTNQQGWFDVSWQKPGMYLIETEIDMPSTKDDADIIRYALYTTLEVNPE